MPMMMMMMIVQRPISSDARCCPVLRQLYAGKHVKK
jgi:hypothetical protein